MFKIYTVLKIITVVIYFG